MNVVATQATRPEQGLSYEQSNNSDRAAIRGWRFQWDMNEVFGGLGKPPTFVSAPLQTRNIGNQKYWNPGNSPSPPYRNQTMSLAKGWVGGFCKP